MMTGGEEEAEDAEEAGAEAEAAPEISTMKTDDPEDAEEAGAEAEVAPETTTMRTDDPEDAEEAEEGDEDEEGEMTGAIEV